MKTPREKLSKVLNDLLKVLRTMPLDERALIRDALTFCRKYGDEKVKHAADKVGNDIHETVSRAYAARPTQPMRKAREIPRIKIGGTRLSSGCDGCKQVAGELLKGVRGKVPKFARVTKRDDELTPQQHELINDYAAIRRLSTKEKWSKEEREEGLALFVKYLNKGAGNRKRSTIVRAVTTAIETKMGELNLIITPGGVRPKSESDEEE